MNPEAVKFILDIRGAARMEGKPIVTTDSQLINSGYAAGVLERAMIWLTPKTVEVYDPVAFGKWPEDLQDELRDAVERFREVASTVPPDKPATAPQARHGVQAFASLKEAVRKVALWEWLHEARALIDQVEAWARDFGWVTRRQETKRNEFLLGEYALDQLYMHAEGNLYILDPVTRFNSGGLGTFDLSIQPSFYLTSIYRHIDGAWYIHLDVGRGVRGATIEAMSAAALKRAVEELRSLL